MFNPIEASGDIKRSFIDYITTSFSFADKDYSEKLRTTLQQPGAVAKGPYLEMNGSYEPGPSIKDLIAEGKASPLFADLEHAEEKEKELKIERSLYLHQATALEKANAHRNLIVTTGTGSGKTECFLIPVIDALLKEEEAGTLNNAVRAIIIYPMNALANDQIKRLRSLLKDHPSIRFGLYNGNTRHTQVDALRDYKSINGADSVPLQNEAISREEMQQRPPHILITNYSMLEYMMLRPKDDAVFSGAQLRYIVLDEAHIYKGATGMETSLLMRRLRARISKPNSVQYILTSATLGGKEADADIVSFGKRLCGVEFKAEDIIRSLEKQPTLKEPWEIPTALLNELAANKRVTHEILKSHGFEIQAEDDNAALFELFLHSKLFGQVRELAQKSGPMTVPQFVNALCIQGFELQEQDFVDFISVCTRAERNKTALIKARYHFFVRALEGAYITLNSPKNLFLQRKNHIIDGDREQEVFECAVCSDCGRAAIVGATKANNLIQVKQWDDTAEYYIIKEADEEHLIDEEDEDTAIDEETGFAENDYAVCPICGAIAGAEGRFEPPCEHDFNRYVRLSKVVIRNSQNIRCSACGFGRLRRFYLGSEAATAVLGTELYDLLPETEEKPIPQQTEQRNTHSLFGSRNRKTTETVRKERQFLCFSDSRSEAAFFACYMEKSYEEFLRRRGIWHVIEECQQEKRTLLGVNDFVNRLSAYFAANKTFRDWDDPDDKNLDDASRRNAWIAILNEMYNARRGTSLASMGLLTFEYAPNEEMSDFSAAMNLTEAEGKALLNLLVMDVVYAGAIEPNYRLNDADREYIFYTPKPKYMKRVKQESEGKCSWLTGWAPRKRANGNYFPNSRVTRLVKATGQSETDSIDLLLTYWTDVFQASEAAELALPTGDFNIRLNGDPALKFYRCKKCGKITPYNCKRMCSSIKCDGQLVECEPMQELENNHYANLYRDKRMQPLFIKEHTAQLAKDQQTKYQKAFVEHKINALSCSTTFEMGVDVGTLETVYMRNVPPSPANYVQRAGRAGRALRSAAFVLTYAKLSSHDFTFYNEPTKMIRGLIQAPVFEIENRKVINRHIYAVALSAFFAGNEDVYDGDNQDVFLNGGGYARLKEFLKSKPEHLKVLLKHSIPAEMHTSLGIDDFTWTDGLIGEEKENGEQGVLERAVADYDKTVQQYKELIEQYLRNGETEQAGICERKLKMYRCGKDDGKGRKSLIDFLVRNNVLPKYGFPVDTVELLTDASATAGKSLQLARDLQMAVAEYAPGSEVIADGKVYKSRYIRKLPTNANNGWESGYFCTCQNCREPNFTKDILPAAGRECVSCRKRIPRIFWMQTLEPRMGFLAESGEGKEVPMHRPEREYKSDDYYIGDPSRNIIETTEFEVNGQAVKIESTSNDSLVVVVREPEYNVCPVCGYASDSPLPQKHKNAYGYECKNREGTALKRILSHDFKTDVAKIEFDTPRAADFTTMVSVLYAILEGMSSALGIERTDIKGTLHKVNCNNRLIYSIILYDAVAGGAGHVRRIVTKDGQAFQSVLNSAYRLVTGCDCDKSCYKCLRNYYNQKLHDELDRGLAAEFIAAWIGPMTHKERENAGAQTHEPMRSDAAIPRENVKNATVDYDPAEQTSWDETLKFLKADITESEKDWLHALRDLAVEKKIVPPYLSAMITPEQDDGLWPDLTWPEHRIAVFCEAKKESYDKLRRCNWAVYRMTDESVSPPALLKILQAKEE